MTKTVDGKSFRLGLLEARQASKDEERYGTQCAAWQRRETAAAAEARSRPSYMEWLRATTQAVCEYDTEVARRARTTIEHRPTPP